MSGRPSRKSAEIGLFSPFFCLFRPFPESLESTWKIQKTEEKGLFPQISSDLLKPPSLKPRFAALQQMTRKRVKKTTKSVFGDFFRHFFDTPGREAREVLFETFRGFRGSGVWRLLYMGIAIAKLNRKRSCL